MPSFTQARMYPVADMTDTDVDQMLAYAAVGPAVRRQGIGIVTIHFLIRLSSS